MADDIVLYAVGDIAPDREDPGTLFQHVTSLLKHGDIAFCQLEAVLSGRGSTLPQARLGCRSKPETARALKEAGFAVVSFASNHCLDFGREAFFDTLHALQEQGLAVIGVGRNLAEARQPAMVERRGTRVAFLAYNTILPQGYWAEEDRPGCAPLRAHTVYEPIEPDQPGTPCRIHTFAHRGDLQGMVKDVGRAKEAAELVVVLLHGGIHFVPGVLPEYQREMAHAAIDAGADLVVGHHAHILKGIEVYRGKAVFYGLCNFAIDLRAPKELLERQGHREISVLNPEWKPDPEYPTYFMPPDSRKTMIVKCRVANHCIESVSFLPTYINKQSQPEVLDRQDPRFGQVLRYVEEISASQGLETRFAVDGDEVRVV